MNKLLWAFIGFAIIIVGCSPEIRHPDLANYIMASAVGALTITFTGIVLFTVPLKR